MSRSNGEVWTEDAATNNYNKNMTARDFQTTALVWMFIPDEGWRFVDVWTAMWILKPAICLLKDEIAHLCSVIDIQQQDIEWGIQYREQLLGIIAELEAVNDV